VLSEAQYLRKPVTADAAIQVIRDPLLQLERLMKTLPLFATFLVLAACAESPTAPSTQPGVQKVSVAQASTLRAARNPAGTGQPGAECGEEDALIEPNGFSSGGFAIAETKYAGSPNPPSLEHGNWHAVSQYDVACYQLSNK
jgi:hypothetical protein